MSLKACSIGFGLCKAGIVLAGEFAPYLGNVQPKGIVNTSCGN